jgi:hypothetical protein
LNLSNEFLFHSHTLQFQNFLLFFLGVWSLTDIQILFIHSFSISSFSSKASLKSLLSHPCVISGLYRKLLLVYFFL